MGRSRELGAMVDGLTTARPRTDRADLEGVDAVAVLFESDYALLVAAARFIVDDRETAEDVVMEAFVSLHRRWRHLREPSEARRYLRSCVLNGARSQLRRRRVRRLLEAGSSRDVHSPVDSAASGVDRVALLDGLRALSTRQREVLVLRFYLGLLETEVAAQLGISVGSVKQHSSRGLAALQRTVEEAR
jgi:RNA polymerase sigma-70 factor (sigma-E family)